MTPRFEWTFNIGQVATMVAFLFLAGMAWRDHHWRLTRLEEWRKGYSAEAIIAMAMLHELKEAVIELKQISKGQENRIEMLENRANFQHRREEAI